MSTIKPIVIDLRSPLAVELVKCLRARAEGRYQDGATALFMARHWLEGRLFARSRQLPETGKSEALAQLRRTAWTAAYALIEAHYPELTPGLRLLQATHSAPVR